MIVSIVLTKKPNQFLTSSSSSSVKIHFKVNCDVLVRNYLKFFMQKFLQDLVAFQIGGMVNTVIMFAYFFYLER